MRHHARGSGRTGGSGEGPPERVGLYVVFSDIPNNRQLRWDEATGQVTPFRVPSNFSNGNTFDWQGRQLSCEHQTARVVRHEYQGDPTVLAATFEGKRLNAPNDVVVHPNDGGILFTDPGYGSHWYYEGDVPARGADERYHIAPKRPDDRLRRDQEANGLVFHPNIATFMSRYRADPFLVRRQGS